MILPQVLNLSFDITLASRLSAPKIGARAERAKGQRILWCALVPTCVDFHEGNSKYRSLGLFGESNIKLTPSRSH